MISSKTSNILKRQIIVQSQHLNLFPKNPNAFKVNNDNKIQWKNIIIICSEIPFSKNTYHKETSQLIWFETHYNWLVSTWYEFLVKDIFGQTLTLLLYLRLNLAVHQSWSSMNALFTFNSRNVSIGLKKTVNTYFGIYCAVTRKKWQFLIRLPLWFQSLVSFKVVCDRATCKWNFGKKIVKTTSSKNFLFFDYFCLQTVSHRKSKSVTIFWKVAVNNDFAKLNGKKPIKIKSRISFHDFQ